MHTAETELAAAQAQLDEKQKELDIVQAVYDAAMKEKQVGRSKQKVKLLGRNKCLKALVNHQLLPTVYCWLIV